MKSVVFSSAVVAVLALTGCSSSGGEAGDDQATSNLETNGASAALSGDWGGDIQLADHEHVDHTYLLVRDGSVRVIALGRDSVLPEQTLLDGKLTKNGNAVKVALNDGSASFQLTLGADGTLSGTADIGSQHLPVSFAKLSHPEQLNANIVDSECSGIKGVLVGYDAALESTSNGRVDALVRKFCKKITTTTADQTVIRKPYLVASVSVALKEFLSVEVLDASPATFHGPALARVTYDASGKEIDLSKSFVQSQASYDKLIRLYKDENSFNFGGGEGSPGVAQDALDAAAHRAIHFENGKLTVDAKLFSYSGRETASGFMVDDGTGLFATLTFRGLAPLGVVDPASPVGKYLAATPAASQ